MNTFDRLDFLRAIPGRAEGYRGIEERRKMVCILVVEQDAAFRTMVADHIRRQRHGWTVYEAYSVEMAEAKAALIHPDIVVIDVNLPGTRGFEAIERIRETAPECRFIVLTLLNTEPFKRKGRDLGVADFISKTEAYDCLIPSIRKRLV